MIEFAEQFLYTPAWEGLSALAVFAGLGGIFMLVFGMTNTLPAKIFAWCGVGLMALVFTFSVLFEELLPTLPQLSAARQLPYALSFAGFALFLVMFVLSGRMVVSGLLPNMAVIFSRERSPEHAQARSEALGKLRPGLLLFAGSIIVFAVSLVGYHGPEVTLGWALG